MRLQYAYFSDVGSRSSNEDSLGVFENNDSFLAIVADGLGGHANGEIASKMALDIISKDLTQKIVEEDKLAYAILNANSIICQAGISGYTTIAALWIENSHAVVANVGDTRIYQFRDGEIIYQSIDHSIVQMAVLVGKITSDALRYHKDRNKLFCVLGADNDDLKVDSCELGIKPGDRFLLCSDGFWEPVTEVLMLQAVSETTNAQEWLNSMIRYVKSVGDPKQDNYTAISILVY